MHGATRPFVLHVSGVGRAVTSVASEPGPSEPGAPTQSQIQEKDAKADPCFGRPRVRFRVPSWGSNTDACDHAAVTATVPPGGCRRRGAGLGCGGGGLWHAWCRGRAGTAERCA